MESTFSCLDDFISGLDEINALLELAQQNQSDLNKYKIFNKSALLLLVGKLEAFFESCIEEFKYKLEEMALESRMIPDSIKLHSTSCVIDENFVAQLRSGNTSSIEKLKALSLLWDSTKTISSLDINCKFNYGRHGGNETIKLFKRIDFENIFATCPIDEERDTLAGIENISMSFESDVNEMTGYRNNILHEAGSPTLTHQQIAKYVGHSIKFANKLTESLNGKLAIFAPKVIKVDEEKLHLP